MKNVCTLKYICQYYALICYLTYFMLIYIYIHILHADIFSCMWMKKYVNLCKLYKNTYVLKYMCTCCKLMFITCIIFLIYLLCIFLFTVE